MSIITNKHLARRDFIKGLVAAGVLSGLQADKLFAQTVTAPLRVCIITLVHGWGGGSDSRVRPIVGNSEFDFTLPSYWQPFTAIRDQCAFIDGLRGSYWGNAHLDSLADILTAGAPANSPTNTTLSPSIDYLLEKNSGKPAIRVGIWDSCYDDKFQLMPSYGVPLALYNDVFEGRTGVVAPAPAIDPVTRELFPYLSAEGNQVLSTINTSKTSVRNKVLSYLDAVTAVQSRVAPATTTVSGTATVLKIPGISMREPDAVASNLDMVRVGFTNDTHRVAVVGMWNNPDFAWTDSKGVQRVGYSIAGDSRFAGDFHQNVAHAMVDDEDIKLAWEAHIKDRVGLIVNFIKDLKNTTDFDGKPLIDNTIVVLTGEIGNGLHEQDARSHIVIGGGSRVRRNRWLHLERVPMTSVGTRNMNGEFVKRSDTDTTLIPKSSYGDLYTKIGQLAGLGSNFRHGFDVMNVAPISL